MMYKHCFIENNQYIPEHFQEKHRQTTQLRCMHELAEQVLQDYPFETSEYPHGEVRHMIELSITTRKRVQEAYEAISKILCYHSALRRAVLDALEEMQQSDHLPEETKENKP